MNALFTVSGFVPLSRVIGEHRRWLVPLTVAIALNLGVLGLVVVPLSTSVESLARRAEAAATALKEAKADFDNAVATRDGQAQSVKDLDRFYRQVLPADVSSARRMTTLKLSQRAAQHSLTFENSAGVTENVRDSELERLKVSYALFGDYDDVRQLIYDIETGPDFIIIDNVVLAEGQDANAPLRFQLDLSTYFRTGSHVR
jgi:Tfp pilus assembly protein PilO